MSVWVCLQVMKFEDYKELGSESAVKVSRCVHPPAHACLQDMHLCHGKNIGVTSAFGITPSMHTHTGACTSMHA